MEVIKYLTDANSFELIGGKDYIICNNEEASKTEIMQSDGTSYFILSK